MDMGRNSKFKDGIRIAAGIYLIYLAVEIFQDGVLGGQMEDGMLAVGWICSVGFIAIGVGIAIYSARDLIRLQAAERQEEEKEEEKEEVKKENAGEAAEEERTAGEPERDDEGGEPDGQSENNDSEE